MHKSSFYNFVTFTPPPATVASFPAQNLINEMFIGLATFLPEHTPNKNLIIKGQPLLVLKPLLASASKNYQHFGQFSGRYKPTEKKNKTKLTGVC